MATRFQERAMKQQRGFTLIEMMVAMAILLVVAGAAVTALMQAQQVTQGVALEANTIENLRAGMHFMIRDLTQAGEGIPPGGIPIPNSSSAVSALNWPGTSFTFPTTDVVLNAVIPGYQQGQVNRGISTTGTVINSTQNTDIITVLYADNSLIDTSGRYLYSNSVNGAGCTGASLSATSVVVSGSCFTMPGTGSTPLGVGNLIMFQNSRGTALEYVTGVSGSTISFASGDPAGLNAVSTTSYPNGNAATVLASGAPPTTMTRVWMITYYLNTTTNTAHPQLVRQVNYPNYPSTSNQANPATVISDDIEDLAFTYDIINSTAPTGTYPNGPGDAPQPASWAGPPAGSDSPQQIRAVNIYLAGRSEYPFKTGKTANYLHENLSTQVSMRSLSFVNGFNH
jgi:prepilin-type N-terminal cleavage/methylation domain-containing protein